MAASQLIALASATSTVALPTSTRDALSGSTTDACDAQRLTMLDARLLAHEPRELDERAQLAHLADHLGIACAIRQPRRARSWDRTPARDDRRALRPHALIEWHRC